MVANYSSTIGWETCPWLTELPCGSQTGSLFLDSSLWYHFDCLSNAVCHRQPPGARDFTLFWNQVVQLVLQASGVGSLHFRLNWDKQFYKVLDEVLLGLMLIYRFIGKENCHLRNTKPSNAQKNVSKQS